VALEAFTIADNLWLTCPNRDREEVYRDHHSYDGSVTVMGVPNGTLI
jgi:hypothetical protein